MLVIFLRKFFLLNSRMQSSISLLQRQWYWSVLLPCYIISNTEKHKMHSDISSMYMPYDR